MFLKHVIIGGDVILAAQAYTDRAVNHFPRMVLLDLSLPQYNGFEVLQWPEPGNGCADSRIDLTMFELSNIA
jgi:hypothetical protein